MSGITMGHGDRWEAFGGRDAETVIQNTIPLIVEHGKAFPGSKREVVWPSGDQGPDEAVVAAPVGIVVADDPFILTAITLPKPEGDASVLMTAFPAPNDGIVRRLVLKDIDEDCLGLEGWIHAETESGVAISFFAVDYYLDPGRYMKGSALEVLLSGLCYSVEAATPRDIVVDDPEAVRGYRESGVEIREGEPLRISTQGAAILLPIEDWDPSDYQFQGPLRQHTQVPNEDRLVNCLTVTVARGDDDDIDIRLLASENVLRGELPSVGGDVAGTMCLMGRRVDEPS